MAEAAFDPQQLALDLAQVRSNYTEFFAGLSEADWSRPSTRGAGEWNLRETAAHLVALTAMGNQSALAALHSQEIEIPELTSRFMFAQYNRKEIDRRLPLSNQELAEGVLAELDRARDIAANLGPGQEDCVVSLPIYNRPVTVVEILGIQVFHPGLHHSAQVADPANVPPLWCRLDAGMRHRIITRVMRAISLLYRYDLGNGLKAVWAFEVGGEGGGRWHVDVSPLETSSAEGAVEKPTITLVFRSTDTFCRLFTNRIQPLNGLLTGELKVKGNPRLFMRFGSLFSVDARK